MGADRDRTTLVRTAGGSFGDRLQSSQLHAGSWILIAETKKTRPAVACIMSVDGHVQRIDHGQLH